VKELQRLNQRQRDTIEMLEQAKYASPLSVLASLVAALCSPCLTPPTPDPQEAGPRYQAGACEAAGRVCAGSAITPSVNHTGWRVDTTFILQIHN
jgi:hypothetical protein